MNEPAKSGSLLADLQRVASSSGLYAVANMLQRGLSFILLPVYTRHLDQADYGALELLTGLSAILFGLLLLGLPSALTKVYHRDCEREEDRRAVLSTALVLDLPPLALGAAALGIWAETIGVWILGEAGRATEIRLTAATVVASSLVAIVLSSFRTREQAGAFALLNFLQFGLGMLLNLALVVWWEMGIFGVLWGNLISSVAALPAGLAMARGHLTARIERRLVGPLLHFGVLVIPTAITGWVITMADRYVLRYYGSLVEVAEYSVGYKIGMILQMGIVWPFQLAWPAVAFSISRRVGHERSFARVLTYLTFIMAIGVLMLSLLSRAGLEAFAGASYERAYQVVPLVALAYAFAGVQFCLSPGVHIAGRTQLLTLYSVFGTLVNLGLNFWFVPRYGMLGATWATVLSYALLALLTSVTSHRIHPVAWESARLARIVVLALLIYFVGTRVDFGADRTIANLTAQAILAGVAFPGLLLASGFLDAGERRFVAGLYRRFAPWTKTAGDGGGPDDRDPVA